MDAERDVARPIIDAIGSPRRVHISEASGDVGCGSHRMSCVFDSARESRNCHCQRDYHHWKLHML